MVCLSLHDQIRTQSMACYIHYSSLLSGDRPGQNSLVDVRFCAVFLPRLLHLVAVLALQY